MIKLLKDLEEENARRTKKKAQVNKSIQIFDSSGIYDYEVIDKIGGGGQVYKVFKKVIYAMKEMNVTKGSTKSFQHFITEYELINLLDHDNIIKTYGIFLSDDRCPLSIILEFCPENMEDKINSKSAMKVFIVFSIYQIAEAMKYVHFRKIIHRDLKPSNMKCQRLVSSKSETEKRQKYQMTSLHFTCKTLARASSQRIDQALMK